MYGVNASKTTEKLRKAYVVGKEQTTEKLKKAYVVNKEQKLEKLWSGFTPLFIGITPNHLFTSQDGKDWSMSELPFSMSVSNNTFKIGLTYGLGKYWAAIGKNLSCSEDGITWTVVKTSSHYYAFKNVFFVNGEIVVYEKETTSDLRWTMHITSDGKNWRTVYMQRLTHPYNSGGYFTLCELLYGTFNGEKVYLWLVAGDFPTHISYSGERWGSKIFKSTTLEGEWEELFVASQYVSSSNSSNVTASQMVLSGGCLYYTDIYSTSHYIEYTSNGSSFAYMPAWSGGETTKSMLTCSNFETIYYDYEKGFRAKNYDKIYTCSLGENTSQKFLQPPYNEEGMIAFPYLSGGVVYGWYKAKDATAFTKTAKVGNGGLVTIVAAYGVDGGGIYTD